MSDQQAGHSSDWRIDYLMLAALWGASFLFMRMGAAEFGPLATAWTRVCIATLFLFPLLLCSSGVSASHTSYLVQPHL